MNNGVRCPMCNKKVGEELEGTFVFTCPKCGHQHLIEVRAGQQIQPEPVRGFFRYGVLTKV